MRRAVAGEEQSEDLRRLRMKERKNICGVVRKIEDCARAAIAAAIGRTCTLKEPNGAAYTCPGCLKTGIVETPPAPPPPSPTLSPAAVDDDGGEPGSDGGSGGGGNDEFAVAEKAVAPPTPSGPGVRGGDVARDVLPPSSASELSAVLSEVSSSPAPPLAATSADVFPPTARPPPLPPRLAFLFFFFFRLSARSADGERARTGGNCGCSAQWRRTRAAPSP